MDERALFTGFWEDESKTTGKVLARIPEGLITALIPSLARRSKSHGRSCAKRR